MLDLHGREQLQEGTMVEIKDLGNGKTYTGTVVGIGVVSSVIATYLLMTKLAYPYSVMSITSACVYPIEDKH